MQTEAPVGHYVRLGLFMPTWKEIRTFYGLIQGILILSVKIEDKNVLIWLYEGRNGLVFEHSSEIAPLKVLIYNKGLHFSSIRVEKVLIFPPARITDLSTRMLYTLFVAITDVFIRSCSFMTVGLMLFCKCLLHLQVGSSTVFLRSLTEK